MTTNNPTSPREELARIIDPVAFSTTYRRNSETDEQWLERKRKRIVKAIAKADEWLSRPPVKAASPEEVEPVAYYNPEHWRRVKPGGEGCSTIYPHPCGTYRTPLYSTPPTSERAEVVAITDEMVNEAMLDAWNEICDDTGCHPQDIEQLGRKRLQFQPRHWSDLTAMRLRGLLAAPDSQGGAS